MRIKLHPALKHGGYSATAVLPGENRADFEKLYQDLIAELVPMATLEEDIVADLARLVWRKQNLATFKRAEEARTLWLDIRSEAFDKRFPNQADPSSWTTLSDTECDEIDQTTDAAMELAQKELGEAFGLVLAGDRATIERLLRDLNIEERLNVLIDKCLKRFLFVRGLIWECSSAPHHTKATIQIKKLHPALKRGGYSTTAVLPGENWADFKELYKGLIGDLEPTGALEEDIVADIARVLWRKQNLATFNRAELARTRWLEIRTEVFDKRSVDNSSWTTTLSDREREILEEVRRIVENVTQNEVKQANEAIKVDEATNAAKDRARKVLGGAFELVEAGDTATVERLLRDLKIEEQLDAMVDKCLKRLLFVRGLKSMSGSSSAPQQRIADHTKTA
jgi:hypothetical protein